MKSELLKKFKDSKSLNKTDHYSIQHFEIDIIAEIINYCDYHDSDTSIQFFELEIEKSAFSDEYQILVTYQHFGHNSSIFLEYDVLNQKIIRAYPIKEDDEYKYHRSQFIEQERLKYAQHPRDIDLSAMIHAIFSDWKKWYIDEYKAKNFDKFDPFIG